MIGLGTLINSAGIIAGGILGHFTGRLLSREQQDSLIKTCGISVIFIAVAGGAYCNSCGISAVVLIPTNILYAKTKNDSPPHHAATGRSLNNINQY